MNDLKNYNWFKSTSKWEKIATRKASLHLYFDYCESSEKTSPLMLNNRLDQTVCVVKNGEINHYVRSKDYTAYINGFDKFFESDRNVNYARQHMVSDSKKFIIWLKANCIKETLSKLSDYQIAQLLSKRHLLNQKLITWQWFGFSGKYAIEKSLQKRLDKYHLTNETIKYILSLDKPIFMLEEDLEIKKIALRIQKNKFEKSKLKEYINLHIEKYGYFIIFDETYSPMSFDYVLERIKKYASNKNLQKEIKATYNNYLQNKKAFDSFRKKEIFSKKDNNFFKFAHEYAQFMESRNQFRGQASFLSKTLFSSIADRLKTNINDVLSFSDEEIISFLKKQEKFNPKIAKKRLENAILLYKDGEAFVETDLTKIRKIEDILYLSEKIGSFKGVVAFPGYVRGKAKIINSIHSLGKLQKSDILIASMTRPDYITAISKAAAIVTDEGGMLCHAAIVSRELKKPCIIGTKIATKVLKDGDLVEVDADKGIVKKKDSK